MAYKKNLHRCQPASATVEIETQTTPEMLTMALFAQAASFMMRKRIGLPAAQWDAQHLSQNFFRALEGDIRVKRDTIIVT